MLEHVILDLDETVISSEAFEDLTEEDIMNLKLNHRFKVMYPYYVVVERPYLQPFLDYLFRTYRVSVWTASSPEYSDWIVKEIILAGRPERQLEFKFDSRHCDVSRKLTKKLKSLDLLWKKYRLPGYTRESTMLLDDNLAVYRSQKNNVVQIAPFHATDRHSHHDDELMHLLDYI